MNIPQDTQNTINEIISKKNTNYYLTVTNQSNQTARYFGMKRTTNNI